MASVSLTLVRRLSTSPNIQQLVKTPTQVFGLEGRYATALYSAATKKKQLDNVEKDMNELHSLLSKDVKFKNFISNPIVNRDDKMKAVDSVATKTKMCESTKNLLTTMVDNKRLNRLNSVINSFKTLMAAHRGEVVCEVTTAKALDATSQKELEATLKGFLKKGQVLQYSVKIDPTLIGGMIVTIGDKYIDLSIKSRLDRYTNAISAAV